MGECGCEGVSTIVDVSCVGASGVVCGWSAFCGSVWMRERILLSCVGVSGVVCHVWVGVGMGVSGEGYRLHVFQGV